MRRVLIAIVCLAALASPAAADARLRIDVVSSRADMVSGGDALVEIQGARSSELTVTVGGRDVSAAFAQGPRALVEGLPPGDSVIEARVRHRRARLQITNHPISGPIFSGPHQAPFFCQTAASGLGPEIDADCFAPTRYDRFYRSAADGAFHPYDAGSPPADVATTTTNDGRTVPYVVRVESGVINRSIYRIGVLEGGWVRKAMYVFGPGCGAGYRQGVNQATGVLDDFALSQGWAVVQSSLNVAGTVCNSALTAETMMMVKERLIERYGVPRYTIGFGGSGGAWSQHVIGEQYPGLLDGIVPQYGFLDFNALLYNDQTDCALFKAYYPRSPELWADTADRGAAEGRDSRMCEEEQAARALRHLVQNQACDPVIPPALIYNAASNPLGLRCSYQEANVNLLGRRASDGFANRPFDNVGIQYGLAALSAGRISPEQFVDLNEKIGGFDIDGNHTAERSDADLDALRRSYRNDFVTSGVGLRTVPIIDIAVGDTDGDMMTGGHEQVFNYMLRERLKAANGTAANQVIFTSANAGTNAGTNTDVGRTALRTMDQWLANIAGDSSQAPPAAKVIANKPAGAVDRCWDRANTEAPPSFCAENAPLRGTPRLVAGESLRYDVLKCRLQPLDRADYAVAFSDDEWRRLERAFPTGACDWSRPSVGREGPPRQWVSYARGPDGFELGVR
jgi:hypothetical protein